MQTMACGSSATYLVRMSKASGRPTAAVFSFRLSLFSGLYAPMFACIHTFRFPFASRWEEYEVTRDPYWH